jgi:hypothetical protein
MATKFLEPGGDADFAVATGNGFWQAGATDAVIATDFVHGSHVKSIRYQTNVTTTATTPVGVLADAGNRISVYIYISVLPNADSPLLQVQTSAGTPVVTLGTTSTGILRLWNSAAGGTQLGGDGPTLATGTWYRLTLAYTLTSTTVNRFEVFVDAVSKISKTNATLTRVGASQLAITTNNNATQDFRSSDHYIDDSTALTDPGNIWVTAKRPNANGTTNGFTTQIGSGGSGYGSGHSPQVNERALSKVNGWSMVGAGSAITEEYSIENQATGDINITGATIIDYMGWVSADSLANETASIVVGGTSSNISLTSTTTLFTKAKGSSSYPAGSTDIGIITTTALTTVSLYECGILVAYIPAVASAASVVAPMLPLMGVG